MSTTCSASCPSRPAELQRLGGPPGTFVGHRLTSDPGIRSAAACPGARPRSLRRPRKDAAPAAGLAQGRGQPADRAVRRDGLRSLQGARPSPAADPADRSACRRSRRSAVAGWEQKPEIVIDAAGKWQAFGEADAALIASGTVSLELALAGVPLVSCYRLDPFARMAAGPDHRLVGAAAEPDRRPAGRARILRPLRPAGDACPDPRSAVCRHAAARLAEGRFRRGVAPHGDLAAVRRDRRGGGAAPYQGSE